MSELTWDELRKRAASDQAAGIRTPIPNQLARSTDPDTSKAAAAKLSGKAGTMRRKLLGSFAVAPFYGHSDYPTSGKTAFTAEEAAERSGYTAEDGAWKRVSDLLNAGLLEDTGQRRPGRSGRMQRVLRITESGRRVLGANP